jgi:hypothetical protein
MLADMSVKDISDFLKIMVSTQANVADLKRTIIDTKRFDEEECEIIEDMFETINRIIVINMNLTRSYKKLMEGKNDT